MAEQKGFAIPEHTQTPNTFFDVTLPHIKSIGELKVLLAIMRQTFGWRKFSDTISMSQLQKITGLSHQGVANGLQLALEHGYIERTPHGQSFSYSLKLLVKEVDQSSKLTSQVNRPEVVKQVDRQLVKQVDTQKKGKEKKESTAFAVLMKHHADRVGKILDGGKQGKAIKSILSAGFSADDAIACYDWALGWSDAPDWSLVQGKIGSWLSKRRSNGAEHKLTATELATRDAERKRAKGWDKVEFA